jgi:hypothetical protein
MLTSAIRPASPATAPSPARGRAGEPRCHGALPGKSPRRPHALRRHQPGTAPQASPVLLKQSSTIRAPTPNHASASPCSLPPLAPKPPQPARPQVAPPDRSAPRARSQVALGNALVREVVLRIAWGEPHPTTELYFAPAPPPVIARSGRKRGTRLSAACCRHAACPHGSAHRKRRGNPEDHSPTTLLRVILPSCHSERSEESLSMVHNAP